MGIMYMVKTTIEIKDDLDQKFRQAIARKKGMRKGVLSEALEEAIEDWIEKKEKKAVVSEGDKK